MANINAFSIDAPECVVCENYSVCKNKRKALCAYYCNEPIVSQAAGDLTLPVGEGILAKHDYRVPENVTATIGLEDIKKELKNILYESLSCNLRDVEGGA